jgi:TolA-binding protein
MKRDVNEGAEAFEKALLRSARIDERHAPTNARARILAAVGAVGVVGASSATAGAVGASVGRLVVVKWLAATAVVGALGVGTFEATHRDQAKVPRPSIEAPAAKVPALDPPSVDPPRVVESPRETPAPAANVSSRETRDPTAPAAPALRRAAPRTPPVEPAQPAPSSLQDEVSTLDRARAAVAAGDSGRALEVLDGYGASFPRGVLRPEATYLRIQALLKAGQREAARELATRLLADHPDSPHAPQLEPLVRR